MSGDFRWVFLGETRTSGLRVMFGEIRTTRRPFFILVKKRIIKD